MIRRIGALLWPALRWSPVLRCGDCRHLFWRYDPRAYVSRRGELGAHCAVCDLFNDAGGEAWALWNDCQGVFATPTYWGRREAEAALAADPLAIEAECIVMPVKVLEEPDWRRWRREFRERERSE